MDADTLLQEAQRAVQAKEHEQARRLLMDLLSRQPRHEQGWLLLASVVDDPNKAIDCLERVLALNPGNTQARELLALAQRERDRLAALSTLKAEPEADEVALTEPGDEERAVPRLGQYLLDFKFITAEQLKAALVIQRRARDTGQMRRLGDILLEQGAITEERLNFALREQNRSFYSLLQD